MFTISISLNNGKIGLVNFETVKMSGTSKTMYQIVKHLPEEKGETLNAGRIFTCFYDYDGNILPNEILVKIFQYLSFTDLRQCALVSKGWRVLSLCPVLWKKVQLHKVTLDVPYLERLVNCGVQQLHMESSKICVNSQPLATPYFESSTFSTLQYLRIEWTDIKIDLLEVIVLMVPNLKCFTFEGSYRRTIFNANIFSALLHLEHLEKLHLFDITIRFSKIMAMLDKKESLKTLQSLTLGCALGNYATLKSAMNFVEKYLSFFPNLQDVELSINPWFYVNDKIFKRLAQLKNLKSLKMEKTKVSSGVMKMLNQRKSFIHLKELHISCEEMDEESLILLLRGSSSIEVLMLDQICLSTAILEALLSLNYLKQLQVQIDNERFPLALFFHDKLQKFDHKLPSLHLRNYLTEFVDLSNMLPLFKYLENLTFHGFHFTEAVLIKILNMKNLKKLDIDFCLPRHIKFSSLRQIQGELYELKELRVKFLDIYNPNFPIECILSRTPNIKLLEVCDYPLNKAFLLGVSTLKRLEELRCVFYLEPKAESGNFFKLYAPLQLNKLASVYVCYKQYGCIPYGLKMVLSMCRKVKKLHIHGSRVTGELFDIIKTMKELEYLTMTKVRMFRKSFAAEILKYCPKLTEHRVKIETLKK